MIKGEYFNFAGMGNKSAKFSGTVVPKEIL